MHLLLLTPQKNKDSPRIVLDAEGTRS
ncbi:hypothetical protein FOXB_15632 [Fusarium oxysporum f. sp. conglutinans Fo5176]|uniref:Uncharacterized protein n=1 Tax=Fusarium oxysporum (strain Fo5176) TaxID=660025 RepID=F9GAF0_FUSOF|nr:hypothetical protein FOXB_15632 [Fusarium oxysporum f. sp. conglutinans Fo5176]